MSDASPSAISFSSFIASLAASALAHLGQGSDTRVDLPLARQSIDLLGLLQEKTQGNLDEEEAKLLESLLYDCRMHFVQTSQVQAPTTD